MASIGLSYLHATILFILHISFLVISISIQYFKKVWKIILQNLNITERELEEIQYITKKMEKIPKHIAFCLDGSDYGLIEQNSNMKPLAKLISWAWASGISIVSLYDAKGQIYENSTELEIYLEKAIVKLRKQGHLPKVEIKFHNVTKNSNELQGIETLDTKNRLNIILFPSNDGKQDLVDTVKTLFIKNEEMCEISRNNNSNVIDISQNKNENEEITEVTINCALRVSLEPNLLVVFGSTSSTLGFLPWHIRLTEIHWLPTFPTFIMDDFSTLLHAYSACDQKIGK